MYYRWLFLQISYASMLWTLKTTTSSSSSSSTLVAKSFEITIADSIVVDASVANNDDNVDDEADNNQRTINPQSVKLQQLGIRSALVLRKMLRQFFFFGWQFFMGVWFFEPYIFFGFFLFFFFWSKSIVVLFVGFLPDLHKDKYWRNLNVGLRSEEFVCHLLEMGNVWKKNIV